MRRRTLFVLSLFLVPALGIHVQGQDAQREGRVSQANCDRIQFGMPLAEVERLLGGPGDVFPVEDSRPSRERVLERHGTGGERVVVLFHDGHVLADPACLVIRDWGMLDWLRDWLGL